MVTKCASTDPNHLASQNSSNNSLALNSPPLSSSQQTATTIDQAKMDELKEAYYHIMRKLTLKINFPRLLQKKIQPQPLYLTLQKTFLDKAALFFTTGEKDIRITIEKSNALLNKKNREFMDQRLSEFSTKSMKVKLRNKQLSTLILHRLYKGNNTTVGGLERVKNPQSPLIIKDQLSDEKLTSKNGEEHVYSTDSSSSTNSANQS